MLEAIKQRRYLIAAALLTIAVVLGTAYLFASKKSEPEYLSKIDRLMFDKKNLAPKYILTLPDRRKAPKIEVKKIIEDGVEVAQTGENPEPEAFDMGKFMASIPLLTRLTPLADLKPLRYVETDSSLIEKVDNMQLPKISSRGKKPWSEYGNPVQIAPNFYKVAIVFKNLGLDTRLTETITTALPSEISFSFSPYAQNAAEMVKNARRSGHETYVDLLLSSPNFLKSDSGPMAMSLTASPEQNLLRLRQALDIDAPLGGMVVNAGVADEDTRDTLEKVIEELKSRGLMMIDATDADGIDALKSSGLPRKKADIVIDDNLSREAIDQQLEQAEETALLNGQVLIAVEPKPVAVMAIHDWINSFSKQLSYEEIKQGIEIKKPFALVPLSMVVVE